MRQALLAVEKQAQQRRGKQAKGGGRCCSNGHAASVCGMCVRIAWCRQALMPNKQHLCRDSIAIDLLRKSVYKGIVEARMPHAPSDTTEQICFIKARQCRIMRNYTPYIAHTLAALAAQAMLTV